MSTVKITQLPTLTSLDANTSNSLFMGVDVTSGVTGKFTAHTLAQGLFSNEILNVGNNQTFLPNTIAQFSSSGDAYIQTNLVNTNDGGTGDFVITASTGTDTTHFIDLGFANKDFVPGSEYNSLGTAISPLDGYLYVQGGTSDGNLIVGTTSNHTEIRFIVGGGTSENVVAKLTTSGLRMMNGHGITFADNTEQNHSATFAESFANGAFDRANAAYDAGNTTTTFAENAYDKANSGATFANAAFARANSGYGQANSAASFANGAFVMANSSYDKANSAASFANGSFTRANSGYDAANSAASFANGAFTQANTNSVTIASSYAHGNAAYDYANTSVQNTSSITVNTNLTVPGTLSATSTVRVPNILSGPQTAITLSFNNSNLVRANIAADLVVTPSSFVAGKFVDLIITNTSGQQRAITHGCSAINSTIGATSFNLGATRTAYLRYFSFDGDLANTYVSATYQ